MLDPPRCLVAWARLFRKWRLCWHSKVEPPLTLLPLSLLVAESYWMQLSDQPPTLPVSQLPPVGLVRVLCSKTSRPGLPSTSALLPRQGVGTSSSIEDGRCSMYRRNVEPDHKLSVPTWIVQPLNDRRPKK
jgi:hypothetical protein